MCAALKVRTLPTEVGTAYVRAMKILRASMVVCGLANCVQLPPEPTQTGQRPEFTVLTAVPPIGHLDYSVTAEGHVEGSLTLKRQVDTQHPLRMAVVWLDPQSTTFQQHLWWSIPLQAGQQVLRSASSAVGTYAFSGEIVGPPTSALRIRSAVGCTDGEDRFAHATLVVYVDRNDNGVLDIANGPIVDHVLSSSEFPTVLLGNQGAINTITFTSCATSYFSASPHREQPVYDDPRLDLVACLREDRFAVDGACGVANDDPAIELSGTRENELTYVAIRVLRGDVEIILDGAQRASAGSAQASVAEFRGQELAVGSHRVRAERNGVVTWEATFTLPDRTWVKEVRPAPDGAFDVHFQEVAGATQYNVSASRTMTGSGVSSPVRLGPGEVPSALSVTARFDGLPFTSSSIQQLPQ